MIKITDKRDCCGCHACYNSCPQKCISMQSDAEGFWYPAVKLESCTDCGLCEKVCPVLSKNTVDNQPLAYACMNKDDQIRQQSSAGGVFTVLAESVLAKQGVVFGAGFNKEFKVVHSWTDSIYGLNNFRGSKYVQSCIGDTYQQTRDFLKQGRLVLFSGTPCQIAGLKSYLGKDYEALICLDIICHGVPSPSVFDKYRAELEHTYASKTRKIAFRRKDYGWKRYSVALSFDNATEYRQPYTMDLFMKGFLQNIYLRPSCYQCSFKTINRQSDMTLADFWGIQNVLPTFDDDRGTSLILVNSRKGATLFSYVADKVASEKVDIDQALVDNPSALKSVAYNPQRALFFKEMATTKDISHLIAKYTRVSFPRKVYRKMRTLLSR